MFWKKKDESRSFYPSENVTLNTKTVPDDWLVMGVGQSPLHCLWWCELLNMETKRIVSVEECDSADDALTQAILKIKGQQP